MKNKKHFLFLVLILGVLVFVFSNFIGTAINESVKLQNNQAAAVSNNDFVNKLTKEKNKERGERVQEITKALTRGKRISTATDELKNIVLERKELLKKIIGEDAEATIKLMFNNHYRSILPAELQGDIEIETIVEGVLEVYVLDDFNNKTSQTKYILNTTSGERLTIHPANGFKDFVESRTKLRIQGYRIDNELLFDGSASLAHLSLENSGFDVVEQPGNPPIVGVENVAIILLYSSDESMPTSPTIPEFNNFLNGKLNNFYKENSYNNMSISGSTYGWYPVDPSVCDSEGIKQVAISAADNDINFLNYDRIIIVKSGMCIGGSGVVGLATLGKVPANTADGTVDLSFAWIKKISSISSYFSVIAHELGHNFGSHHASFLECGENTIATAGCTIFEYGDAYDIMGGSPLPGHWIDHFNAPHKELMGWLNGSLIATIVSSGFYELAPIESNTTELKALKIQRNLNDYLYIEYRQPIGFDFIISPTPPTDIYKGALLHLPFFGLAKTHLLDASPTTEVEVDFVTLHEGSSFTDPNTGTVVTITANNRNLVNPANSRLTVRVDIGKTDFVGPTINLTSPKDGATLSGNNVLISADVFDESGISKVDFYYVPQPIGMRQLIGTDTTEPYNLIWDSTIVANGNYNIYAYASDNSGTPFGVPNNVSISQIINVDVSNVSTTIPQTPWQSNEVGTLYTNIAWNYTMGYHFTPQKNGQITKLGGFFNGPKNVYLWNKSTGALLAQASVSSSNSWNYTSIAPVNVLAGVTYTVAAEIGGSGGSYRNGVTPTFPQTYGDITIEATTYIGGSGRPINSVISTMYGQADIEFVPDGSVSTNEPPIADAGSDKTVSIGESVSFSGAGSNDPDGSIVSYAWNFGDGATGSGITPTHTYTSTGNKIVTLTVTDNQGATDSDTAIIVVNSVVQPKLHISLIDMFLISGRGKVRAKAEITVVDNNDSTLSGVSVRGHWDGLTFDSDVKITDSVGIATIFSDYIKKKKSGTFTFTIDSITKTGYIYDSSKNIKTSDSISR